MVDRSALTDGHVKRSRAAIGHQVKGTRRELLDAQTHGFSAVVQSLLKGVGGDLRRNSVPDAMNSGNRPLVRAEHIAIDCQAGVGLLESVVGDQAIGQVASSVHVVARGAQERGAIRALWEYVVEVRPACQQLDHGVSHEVVGWATVDGAERHVVACTDCHHHDVAHRIRNRRTTRLAGEHVCNSARAFKVLFKNPVNNFRKDLLSLCWSWHLYARRRFAKQNTPQPNCKRRVNLHLSQGLIRPQLTAVQKPHQAFKLDDIPVTANASQLAGYVVKRVVWQAWAVCSPPILGGQFGVILGLG